MYQSKRQRNSESFSFLQRWGLRAFHDEVPKSTYGLKETKLLESEEHYVRRGESKFVPITLALFLCLSYMWHCEISVEKDLERSGCVIAFSTVQTLTWHYSENP